MKPVYIIVVVVIAALSCKPNKEDVNPNKENTGVANFDQFVKKTGNGASYYGTVSYTATRVVSGISSPVLYNARGDFFSKY
jgi:hypothetical protein